MAADKQHAHKLIELMPPSQVTAAIGMLRASPRPGRPAIAPAPIDDERNAVAKSKAWFEQRDGRGIPHEEVLAEFGLSPDDLKSK